MSDRKSREKPKQINIRDVETVNKIIEMAQEENRTATNMAKVLIIEAVTARKH